MGRVVVRYKTKPDAGDENQRLVENVFTELSESRPEGLRYATLRLEDGVTFVHIADVDTPDGTNPLSETAAFKEFQSELPGRCEEPPAPMGASLVGSYGLFAE